jgi:hypothetical protein
MSILNRFYNQIPGNSAVKKASVLKILDLIKDVDQRVQIESILLYGLDSKLIAEAKCFQYGKEINSGIISFFKSEPDYQKRVEFFISICDLSLAKLTAIVVYKLPISDVVEAKCFGSKECEAKSLKILSALNVDINNNNTVIRTIFNLIKDCDTVEKMNRQTRAL